MGTEFFIGVVPLLDQVVGGGISLLPLTRGLAWTDFIVEGFNEDNPDARIIADRTFSEADSGEPSVALVNRDFAERSTQRRWTRWRHSSKINRVLTNRPDPRAAQPPRRIETKAWVLGPGLGIHAPGAAVVAQCRAHRGFCENDEAPAADVARRSG